MAKLICSPSTEVASTTTSRVLPSPAVSLQRVVVPAFPARSSGRVRSGFGWPVVPASFSETVVACLSADSFGSGTY